MQLNSKYFIHPSRKEEVLTSLYEKLINRLPSREVVTDVVLEHYYVFQNDHVSIEQIFAFKQLQKDSLTGKPKRIRFKRESLNSLTHQEFGFTSAIELRKALEFLNYSFIGLLTQIRTGFFLKNSLIELPIVINETKECGCFIEVGDTVGAIEDISNLLEKIERIVCVSDEDLMTESYGIFLQRAGERR